MNLGFIKELLESRFVNALCWTLFHSLWQGLIFAIIAGVIIMLTRRSKPALRYNALTALYGILVLTIIATFLYEQQKVRPVPIHQTSVYHPLQKTADYLQTWAPVSKAEKLLPAQMLNGFFSQYAYLIVAVWLFILGAKSVRMIFTLLYTRHLRKYKSHVPSPDWRKEFILLCHQLNINRPITLLESEIIKLPVVFGHLKPIIFIPLGLLSNLAPELVEAILVHELAHIRRNDYLVNLLQNIIEALFFFNPGILWISSLIREERESCCDDVAIGYTKNKKKYVEALIRFKELSLYNDSKSAVAFPGNKNSFIKRVRRIVQNTNYTLSPLEKGSLLSCCVIAALLVLAFAHPIQTHEINKFASADKVSKSLADIGVPALVRSAGSIPLSGKKPDKRLANVEQKSNEKKSATPYIYSERILDTLPISQNPSAPNGYGDALEKMRLVIADLVSEKVVKDTAAVLSFGLTNTELVVNDQRQPEALHQMLKTRYGIHENYGLYYGPVKITGTGLFINLSERRPEMLPPPRPPKQMKDISMINPFQSLTLMINSVIDDLVIENIVKGRSSLKSFNLTNEFLEVNGKKQPDDIQEKLREKYLVEPPVWVDHRLLGDPNFGLHYNLETGSIGIGITRDKSTSFDGGRKTKTSPYFPSRGLAFLIEHQGNSRSPEVDELAAKYGYQKFFESMESSGPVLELNDIIHQLAMENKISDARVPDGAIEAAIRAKKAAGSTGLYKLAHPTQENGLEQTKLLVRNLIDELLGENIIKDKSSLTWFGLTDSVFIINGIKQPDEIHQKFKWKYLKDPRFGLFYGPVKMNGMGNFIDKIDADL
jgi:beta-lactamase regulating signal transducer with metallopeptidase domain